MGKNNGTEQGPDSILQHIPRVSTIHKPVSVQRFSVHVFPTDFPATQLSILRTVEFPSIVLGGDHSITYSSFKKFAQNYPGAALIVFDAHPDLMHEFEIPTHENYLRMLISEKIALQVILIGARAWDTEEVAFANDNNVKLFSVEEVNTKRDDICDAIMALVKDAPAVYASIDIDVVDPAFAPGTGYPEPGGMSSTDLLYFCRRLKCLGNLKGIDIVEVNPQLDSQQVTAKLAAKVLGEFA